ncbi:MAG: Arabinose operon regulatory protein [Candidatus Erwinia impunctatus]|nr:Arabinose operon regulatory protein [Culicoides impunctatus]
MTMRLSQTDQQNPLLPGYPFNAWLVAGLTPINQHDALDFFIDRPSGMKGYIINLTIKGCGQIFQGDAAFHCGVGELLLFSPQSPHYYGRSPEASCWHHRWIYFRPRAYWSDWLKWQHENHGMGRLQLTESLLAEFDVLFVSIEQLHNSGRRFAEDLAMNLLERLLLRAVEEDPRRHLRLGDARIIEACQYLTSHLATEVKIDEVAGHVCLSPSRFAHLFREQMGVNMLRWREDQRVARARLLLQNTSDSIAAVGRAVGYDDQLYFSRVFRKRVGISPSDFRRRTLEAHDALVASELCCPI